MKFNYSYIMILLFIIILMGVSYFNHLNNSLATICKYFTYNLIKSTVHNADYKYIKNGSSYIDPDILDNLKKDKTNYLDLLSTFAGVENGPNQGYNVIEVEQSNQLSKVKMLWKYKTGTTDKLFYLNKVNGKWKIYQIRQSR